MPKKAESGGVHRGPPGLPLRPRQPRGAHRPAPRHGLDPRPPGPPAPAPSTAPPALVEAVEAATAWHRAQHHRAQTRAAAQAAALLREAATLTGAPPPTRPTRAVPGRAAHRTGDLGRRAWPRRSSA
ncbi:hypothetical protein [Streptomyces rubiginosohelvolus]|uniref:hypothetical protein n=1 Tax=Streptomyces rubiginosohelvolus TaxID=67362 RepID=UPI003443C783